jgi:hypothetical protein
MCTFDMMVDNAKWMMKLARKVLGQRLFKMAMRASIYGQFVGGEGKHDIQGKVVVRVTRRVTGRDMMFGICRFSSWTILS